MKFIKENWFRLSMLIVVVLIFSVVLMLINLNERLENKRLVTENIKSCSNQQKIIEDYYKEKFDVNKSLEESIASTNHYNQEKNRCYVEVSSGLCHPDTYTENNMICDYSTNIFDAYEKNLILDSFIISSSKKGIYTETYTDYSASTSGIEIASTTYDSLEYLYMNK